MTFSSKKAPPAVNAQAHEPLASPCIGLCQLDVHQICQGCYRHSDEIRQWVLQGPEGQRRILARAAERRRQASSSPRISDL